MLRGVVNMSFNQRLVSVIGITCIALAVIFSLSLWGVNRLTGLQNYSSAFVKLAERTEAVETQFAKSQFSLATGRLPDSAPLNEALMDLILIFQALRLSDPDSGFVEDDAGHDEAFEERLSDILDTVVSPADVRRKAVSLGIDHDDLPMALADLWESEKTSRASMEREFGLFIISVVDYVQHLSEIRTTDELRSISDEHDISFHRIEPYLKAIPQMLDAQSRGSLRFLMPALWSIPICGLLLSLTFWLVIFRPMARQVNETQAGLIEERDRAIAAEATKGEFLAVMSHELRTPMNAVTGFANLLRTTGLDPIQTDYVETIVESSENLVAILNDILDFSKFEAGKLELEDHEICFDTLIQQCCGVLGPSAEGKKVDLVSYVDPAIPRRLIGDSGRMRQILINLIGNAIKFTDSGGVAIEVHRTGDVDQGMVGLELLVIDTGVGISPDGQDSIFDAFSQADGSVTRKFGGTGLGLAICRKLVTAMGGVIGVDSDVGAGCTFRIELALEAVPMDAAKVNGLDDEQIRGKRILVVDDNALNRRVFQLALDGFGAHSEAAPDAQAALGVLIGATEKSEPFDLVIVDHLLPGIDGLAFARLVSADARLTGLKLVLSSCGMPTKKDALKADGFHAALKRPFRTKDLHAAIVGALDEAAVDGASLDDAFDPLTQREENNTEEPLTSATEGQQGTFRTPGRAMRVLLAEDNTANQRLMVTVMEKMGIVTDVANNGAEALQFARSFHYDAILMDVSMPVLDGVEAARRIRSTDGPNMTTPIVCVTANSLKGDRERYLAAGMDDYLSKPVDMEKLVESLIRAFSEGSADDVSSDKKPVVRAAAG